MSVQQVSTLLYIGLSTDSKPTAPVNGSRFIEYDTDTIWYYAGAWYQVENVVITEPHKHIHDMITFMVDYNSDDGSPISDNASQDVFVSVPEGIEAHVFLDIWSEGLAQIYVYEDPTVSNQGTALTPRNRHRGGSDTTSLVVKHTPTVTDVGTPIVNGKWLGNSKAFGSSRDVDEIIFYGGKTYLLRTTARANNLRISQALSWYEE